MSTSCTKMVVKMQCEKCNTKCKRNGVRKNKQRYYCAVCKKCFQDSYSYRAYNHNTNSQIVSCLKEGCGIRSTARLLGISKTTVISRIVRISEKIKPPLLVSNRTYEVDELFTYYGNKANRICVIYALERQTKLVVRMKVGKRNNRNLKVVTEALVLSKAMNIFSDKLESYKHLVPKEIHALNMEQTILSA